MRWLIALVFTVVFALSTQAQTVQGDWMSFRWGDLPASVAASKLLRDIKTDDRSPQPQNEAEAYDPNGIVLVTAKYAAAAHQWDAEFGFLNGRLISVKLKSSGDIRDAAMDQLVAIYGAPSLQTEDAAGKVFRWRDPIAKNYVMCTIGADGSLSIVYRPLAAASNSGL